MILYFQWHDLFQRIYEELNLSLREMSKVRKPSFLGKISGKCVQFDTKPRVNFVLQFVDVV